MIAKKANYSAQSFRDRDGFLVIEKNSVKRYIKDSYKAHYVQLMDSGLYQELVTKKLLVQHREIPMVEQPPFYKVIEPEFIPFVSYPYEWTFDQWKEVAVKTLQINGISLKYGMILKDASPFNFTFFKGHCIFIDSLSFEIYQPGAPWIAYRQYCQSILGPLTLIGYRDAQWGNMFQTAINGWHLSLVSRILPLKTWFNKSLLLHIHLHARTQHQKVRSGLTTNMNAEKLLTLWKLMERGIGNLEDEVIDKNWAKYYQESISSQHYLQEKVDILNAWLPKIAGGTLIDLGANTGKFSLLAAPHFEQVIAIESDVDCVKQLQTTIRKNAIPNIETVWADLTLPSAAIGWENAERSSLIARLDSNCLMALALVHHLCITHHLPLEMVANLFSNLTGKWAIVEFIPKNDPKIREMFQNRKDVFEDYSESNFMASFESHFTLKETFEFQNTDRKLYLWEKK